MAATAYTTLVNRLRIDGNDTSTSNFKPGETPAGLRNGSNTAFRLSMPNIVSGSIYLTYGSGTIHSNTGFTILDAASGYISMNSAPDASVTQPFFFDYYFQWFTDADYKDMLDSATQELGGTAGTDLDAGLYPAQIQYALSHYWNRRASQYANLFSSKGGTAEADPHTPTLNFAALAKQARATGDKLRDSYMQGFGQNLQPASGTMTYGMDPITPRY